MIKRILSVAIALLALISFTQVARASDDMMHRIIHATSILRSFKVYGKPIPHRLIANARGIAILDMDKGGFIVSGSGATGIVVARTENGWSAPSAISTGSFGLGFQVGFESAKLVLLLNDDEAVAAFFDNRLDKITLGSDATIVAGPEQESAEYLTISPADIYAYKMTNGAFFGVEVKSKVISTDANINYLFYGKRIPPGDLLAGKVERPPEAAELYEALNDMGRYHPPVAATSSLSEPNSSSSSHASSSSNEMKKRYYYGTPSYEAPPVEQSH